MAQEWLGENQEWRQAAGSISTAVLLRTDGRQKSSLPAIALDQLLGTGASVDIGREGIQDYSYDRIFNAAVLQVFSQQKIISSKINSNLPSGAG